MALAGGLNGLGGRRAHDSTPHNSTQGRAGQRSAADQLLQSGTIMLYNYQIKCCCANIIVYAIKHYSLVS
jgi:hypothetical protein